jgi:hypothetical protein
MLHERLTVSHIRDASLWSFEITLIRPRRRFDSASLEHAVGSRQRPGALEEREEAARSSALRDRNAPAVTIAELD